MGSLRALTLDEVVAVTSRLTGRSCTARRVRYLLVNGGLGTDVQRRPHGRTRLYGVLDVALVQLALALEQQGVSSWVVRVVITYLRDDLVRAWRTGAPLGVAIRGVHATLEPALKGRPAWAATWVPLRTLWQGLDTAVQGACDTRDKLWMYRPVATGSIPRNTT